ncbi:MAG: hypothetical protein SFV18_04305 [Bryobacteraceae bacterium]|nr:hypothetical protein [Bryobacteraceae bacterium]
MEVTPYAFEFEPFHEPFDETSVNLRAHLDRIPDEKLARYSPSMTAEEVMEWDGNFKNDGTLFLVCCDRDVEIDEYRRAVEECIAYRERVQR